MLLVNGMRIGRQMAVLVALVLLGIAGLTTLSWLQVERVYQLTNFSNENSIPSISDIDAAVKNVTTLRVTVWKSLSVTDAEQSRTLEETMVSALAGVEQSLKKYESADVAGEEGEVLARDTALLAADRAALAAYRELAEKVQALSRQNKNAEARDYLLGHQQTVAALGKAFDDHVQFNIEMSQQHAQAAAVEKRALMMRLAAVGAAICVLVAVLGRLFTRAIAGPINRAVGAAELIAQGRIGNGLQLEGSADTEVGRLMAALRQMDAKLAEVVGSVSTTAGIVGSASRQIAQGNDDLSSRTQEQASALEETAATMEEISSTVRRNAENVHQADRLGRQAREQSDASKVVVERTMAAMEEINVASRKIGDIINVIDEIAFQTNLLALNAAVEAARAGEQGRGFAVVASEVRNLAQRSATAAKEIKSLIQDSMEKVSVGTELVNTSGKALNEIVVDVRRVTDIVAEIATATAEQSSAIEQINQAVTQMDSTTQQNAALVEEAASASQSMDQQTRELLGKISFFSIAGQERAGQALPASGAMPGVAVTQAVVTEQAGRPVPARARPGAAKPAPPVAAAARPLPLKRAVGDEQSWSEF